MTTPRQPTETQNSPSSNTRIISRPLVLNHRSPHFSYTITDWLQTRFQLLEPDDPDFPTLSQSVRALAVAGPSPLTAHTIRQLPSLELVVCSGAGVDHVDLAECKKRGVKVTNAGDAFSADVADYAVGLLIDVLRHVSASHRFVRAGLWPVKGGYPLASKVGGKRVGIVGLGSIGSEVAKRLEAFGCEIAYNSRKKRTQVSYTYYANVIDLATNSDALIVCCASTKETHHLINKDVMTALGKSGVVVNVGRGALIDEKELVKFLVRGEIGGAGLDVYENEPKVPEELLGLDNVVLSSHTAVCTPESMEALKGVVVGNLEAFFSNKPLLSQIVID
ncbi:glyoxylate/hydroxypyruvate reductase HPR3-like [Apium graveolens]|uniref:glyoxylate/hydroxypyruvate reductase HPR3-like n=1 Tax=Apium graveolens TaxID=4045 RepID=UPI003D78FA5D